MGQHVNRYFKFIHDFPRLAHESDFYFHLHRGKVDWLAIESIDVDDIIYGRNFNQLEQRLDDVINFDLDRDCDRSAYILHQNFVKIFRLAQLGVNYLSYCLLYLDGCIVNLQEKLTTTKDKYQRLKSQLNHTNSQAANRSESHKCKECGKLFITENYLNSHEKRRHSEEIEPVLKSLKETGCQTEKIENRDTSSQTKPIDMKNSSTLTDLLQYCSTSSNTTEIEPNSLKEDITLLKKQIQQLKEKKEEEQKIPVIEKSCAKTMTDPPQVVSTFTQYDQSEIKYPPQIIKKKKKRKKKAVELEDYHENETPTRLEKTWINHEDNFIEEPSPKLPCSETTPTEKEGIPEKTLSWIYGKGVTKKVLQHNNLTNFEKKLEELGLNKSMTRITDETFHQLTISLGQQRNLLAQKNNNFLFHRKRIEQQVDEQVFGRGTSKKPETTTMYTYDVSSESPTEEENIVKPLTVETLLEYKSDAESESDSELENRITSRKQISPERLSVESLESDTNTYITENNPDSDVNLKLGKKDIAESLTKPTFSESAIDDLLKEFAPAHLRETSENSSSSSKSSNLDDLLRNLSDIKMDQVLFGEQKAKPILKSSETTPSQDDMKKKKVLFADSFEFVTNDHKLSQILLSKVSEESDNEEFD